MQLVSQKRILSLRVAVWHTGHPIADTIASCIDGTHFNTSEVSEEIIKDYDCHVAYGVLRGTADVFKSASRLGKPWVHLDRGYYGASHFDGTYRISLNGTQQTGFWPEPSQHKMSLQPWRGFDKSKPVLVCPPTEIVSEFFNCRLRLPDASYYVRFKGDPNPINFQDYNYVLTFNSSVGWQAIAAGIPCISDTRYSMVGSFYHNILLADIADVQYSDRERLFGTMSSLQMTLDEIKQGKLWLLLSNLLSISASMAANQLPPM